MEKTIRSYQEFVKDNPYTILGFAAYVENGRYIHRCPTQVGSVIVTDENNNSVIVRVDYGVYVVNNIKMSPIDYVMKLLFD